MSEIWWHVTEYSKPRPVEVVSVTAQCVYTVGLLGRKRRNLKHSSWVHFYPTEAEADAKWLEFQKAKDRSDEDRNIRHAARDLYEALDQAVTSMQDSGYSNDHVAVRAGRAALAKARGEQ